MKSLTLAFSLVTIACTALTGCGVSTQSILPGGAASFKEGMTRDEVSAAAGKPAYQYTVNGNETWVYSKANPAVEKAKSTALNMLPVAGPLVSLGTSALKKPVEAKSAVTFGEDGTVSGFEQAEVAAAVEE